MDWITRFFASRFMSFFPPLYRLPNSFCLDTAARSKSPFLLSHNRNIARKARRFAYWTLDLRPKREHKFLLERNPLCCSDHAKAGGTMLKTKITLLGQQGRCHGLRMPCRSSPKSAFAVAADKLFDATIRFVVGHL